MDSSPAPVKPKILKLIIYTQDREPWILFWTFYVLLLCACWLAGSGGHWFGVIWTHSSIFFSEIFTAESSECEPDKSTADIFDSGSDGSYIDDLDNDFVPTSDLDEIDVSLYSVYTQYYKVD